MTPNGWGTICRKIAERSEVEHFSPHALRRSFTTIAADQEVDLRTLMEMGRWRKPDQAVKYVQLRSTEVFNKRFSPALAFKENGAGVAPPAPAQNGKGHLDTSP